MAKKKTDWTVEKLLGQVVTEFREKRDLSQEELAHRAGLSPSAIQKYEAGEREPRSRALLQLAGALDVDPAALLRSSYWVPSGSEGRGYFAYRLRPLR